MAEKEQSNCKAPFTITHTMNRIDRAFKRQKQVSEATMKRELPTLEVEIRDLTKQMRALWERICTVEGIDPMDIPKMERLIVSDENEKLGAKYQAVSRLLVLKVHRYKAYCKALGIAPDLGEKKPEEPAPQVKAEDTHTAKQLLIEAKRKRDKKKQRGNRRR